MSKGNILAGVFSGLGCFLLQSIYWAFTLLMNLLLAGAINIGSAVVFAGIFGIFAIASINTGISIARKRNRVYAIAIDLVVAVVPYILWPLTSLLE